MPNDYSKFPFSKEKKKKAAMREILDLTGDSLLAQRAELSKPSQASCKNCLIAFSMLLYTGFVYTSNNPYVYTSCCNLSAHCKKQLTAFWSG